MPYIWMQPVDLCAGLLQVIVENLCPRNFVEGVCSDH